MRATTAALTTTKPATTTVSMVATAAAFQTVTCNHLQQLHWQQLLNKLPVINSSSNNTKLLATYHLSLIIRHIRFSH